MEEKLSNADIARRNGALSRGPVTESGKARLARRSRGEGGSARNGFKHGLTAKNFLMTPPEENDFRQQLDALVKFWNPQSSDERYLVVKLARAACPPKPWRRRNFQHDRAERLQHGMIDLGTDIVGPEIERDFQTIEEASAHRNMDRLSRERLRAKEAINAAQARRPSIEKENFHAEPTDASDNAPEKQAEEPLCPAA